ncbi:hypothetical protein [Streptomyces sp. NPDC060194]|uniref:hypothetical protein n=1 Tax=Streptomyces sp. NPDC060194 TaxID=3347069 RepID=UPI003646D421
MPRPNAAQLVYGSATVVCSALLMLLLSGASSVLGVAAVVLVATALGVLVAVKVPAARAPYVLDPRVPERVRAGAGSENRVAAGVRR